MRRSSQELSFNRYHDHNSDKETWDGFCPDISMPMRGSPSASLHHTRRHSGLCPDNTISQECPSGHSLPTQITVKPRPCRQNSSGYHHDYYCQNVTPVDNLSESYGLVENPGDIKEEEKPGEAIMQMK